MAIIDHVQGGCRCGALRPNVAVCRVPEIVRLFPLIPGCCHLFPHFLEYFFLKWRGSASFKFEVEGLWLGKGSLGFGRLRCAKSQDTLKRGHQTRLGFVAFRRILCPFLISDAFCRNLSRWRGCLAASIEHVGRAESARLKAEGAERGYMGQVKGRGRDVTIYICMGEGVRFRSLPLAWGMDAFGEGMGLEGAGFCRWERLIY